MNTLQKCHCLLIYKTVSRNVQYLSKVAPLKRFSKNVHTSSVVQNIPRRNFAEMKYKRKDEIPDSFTIIYKAPLGKYLSGCKYFSTFSFMCIGGLTLLKLLTDFQIVHDSLNLNYGVLVSSDTELYVFCAAFFLVNVLIRITISRLPVRIYRNNASYIAVFNEQIPFVKNQLNFAKGEVSMVPPSGILPWREARYRIKNAKAILLENYFKTPSELNQMLVK